LVFKQAAGDRLKATGMLIQAQGERIKFLVPLQGGKKGVFKKKKQQRIKFLVPLPGGARGGFFKKTKEINHDKGSHQIKAKKSEHRKGDSFF
jgi:hypothetical protein